jgi:hypothetical protein
VQKQFGKPGFSVLHESKNRPPVARLRRKKFSWRRRILQLREILRWGIPEPGGTGGTKGLPTSFLWTREVVPHLAAASVTDFAGLDVKIAEAQELDSGIRVKDAELDSLRTQLAGLDCAGEALREASDLAAACRDALSDTAFDTLAGDLKKLGIDAVSGLRNRRQQLSSS